jgi:hypothetical protein
MRLRSHESQKLWWIEASSITLEHFPTRPAALAAEAAAIIAEDPVYNIAGRVKVS